MACTMTGSRCMTLTPTPLNRNSTHTSSNDQVGANNNFFKSVVAVHSLYENSIDDTPDWLLRKSLPPYLETATYCLPWRKTTPPSPHHLTGASAATPRFPDSGRSTCEAEDGLSLATEYNVSSKGAHFPRKVGRSNAWRGRGIPCVTQLWPAGATESPRFLGVPPLPL
jgi:hypothetical protein